MSVSLKDTIYRSKPMAKVKVSVSESQNVELRKIDFGRHPSVSGTSLWYLYITSV